MADNTQLPVPSTSGDVIAADDIAGVKYQRVKITLGADGVNGGDISSANPLPIDISDLVIDQPTMDTPSLPVRQAPQKYTDYSFSQVGSGLLAPELVQIGSTGSGMAINQSAGNLVITTGTTANSEIVLRTVDSFNGALTLKYVNALSQRIVNNNFYIELVDIIGDGLIYNIVNTTTVDVTKTAHGFNATNVGQRIDICALSSVGVPMEAVIASIPDANTIRLTVAGYPASGSGTCSLTGWNKIEINHTGTGATAAFMNTRRRGWQNTSTSHTTPTTVAPGYMGSLNVDNGIVSFAVKTISDTIGILTNRGAFDINVPEPNRALYLQLRAKNGTTNPASTTTWTVGMIRVEDFIPVQVDIVGTRQSTFQNSLPVSFPSAQPVSGTVSANATLVASAVRAGFVAGAGIWYDDSATTLAGNATFTGTSRDLTVTATATAMANAATYAKELRVSAESDVTGTLWLEVSRDNTNWRRIKSVATGAVTGGGFYAEIVHQPSWRHARVGYTNGAGAQTRFSIGSILMAA